MNDRAKEFRKNQRIDNSKKVKSNKPKKVLKLASLLTMITLTGLISKDYVVSAADNVISNIQDTVSNGKITDFDQVDLTDDMLEEMDIQQSSINLIESYQDKVEQLQAQGEDVSDDEIKKLFSDLEILYKVILKAKIATALDIPEYFEVRDSLSTTQTEDLEEKNDLSLLEDLETLTDYYKLTNNSIITLNQPDIDKENIHVITPNGEFEADICLRNLIDNLVEIQSMQTSYELRNSTKVLKTADNMLSSLEKGILTTVEIEENNSTNMMHFNSVKESELLNLENSISSEINQDNTIKISFNDNSVVEHNNSDDELEI